MKRSRKENGDTVKAVALVSGGLDSTLAVRGFEGSMSFCEGRPSEEEGYLIASIPVISLPTIRRCMSSVPS